jgi:HSP20 family protein
MKSTKKETKSFGEFPREIDSHRNNAFFGIAQRGIIPLQSFNGSHFVAPHLANHAQTNNPGLYSQQFVNPAFGVQPFTQPFSSFQQQQPNPYFQPQFNQQPTSNNPAFYGAQEVTTLANISEDEEDYIIELAVPGYKNEDCKVKVKDRVLYVFGRREVEKETLFYSLKEYRNTFFERAFLISDEINTDEIEATCADGILKLHLPKKSEETLQEKEIEITEEQFA